MVAVGGITRLTGSGLSIVEWQPIMGTLPPLGPEAWDEAFRKYQQSPQYQQVNRGMTLAEFKYIFAWEYVHRLVGRLVGVLYFVPWLYFHLRGRLSRALSARLLVGGVLGGVQGALGWYMVQSGLVDEPRVSHYRLAAHLSLALILLGYLLWALLELLHPREEAREGVRGTAAAAAATRLTRRLAIIGALLALQIVYGAFTAGLRAGAAYPTWPTMNGQWIPAGLGVMEPAWRNLLDNPTAVHFIHRILAYVLVLLVLAAWLDGRRLRLSRRQALGMSLLAATMVLQVLLGIATVVLVVPVAIATLHQVGACLVLVATLLLLHELLRERASGLAPGR